MFEGVLTWGLLLSLLRVERRCGVGLSVDECCISDGQLDSFGAVRHPHGVNHLPTEKGMCTASPRLSPWA